MKNLKYKIKSEIPNPKSKIIKGFSLVELLVVITIIAILSVVAYTAMGGQTVKARDSKRKQDLSAIQSALEIHFIAQGTYPSADNHKIKTGSDADALNRKELSDLPGDPKDETGATNYYYWTNAPRQEYLIGAVLENEGSPTAYVIGNTDVGATNDGKDQADGGGNACDVRVSDATCFPYALP